MPVTVIEPGEECSGFGPLHVFNAYPRKNRHLIDAGYRDAKRVLATRRRHDDQAETRRRRRRPSAAAAASGAPPATEPASATTPGKVVSLRAVEPSGES